MGDGPGDSSDGPVADALAPASSPLLAAPAEAPDSADALVLAAQAKADEAFTICQLALVATTLADGSFIKSPVCRAGVQGSHSCIEQAVSLNQQAADMLAAAFLVYPGLAESGTSAAGMMNRVQLQLGLLGQMHRRVPLQPARALCCCADTQLALCCCADTQPIHLPCT